MMDEILTLKNWILFLSTYFGLIFLLFCGICIKDLFTLLFEGTRNYVDLPTRRSWLHEQTQKTELYRQRPLPRLETED